MAKARKLTASERDGVQYNRAKRWQIVMAMGSNSTAMAFSSLLGLISYLANSGYGIMVAAVGMVLTACRVFDGVVDPFLALLIDRVNTRFGKIRLFMSIGFFDSDRGSLYAVHMGERPFWYAVFHRHVFALHFGQLHWRRGWQHDHPHSDQ